MGDDAGLVTVDRQAQCGVCRIHGLGLVAWSRGMVLTTLCTASYSWSSFKLLSNRQQVIRASFWIPAFSVSETLARSE
jgi:hypothetical protein